jgi:hypothetical protein
MITIKAASKCDKFIRNQTKQFIPNGSKYNEKTF